MIDKKEVKQRIGNYEYLSNGFDHLSGADVRVVNLQVGKTKATADIILTDFDEKHRYNNCEYNLTELGF